MAKMSFFQKTQKSQQADCPPYQMPSKILRVVSVFGIHLDEVFKEHQVFSN